MTLLTSGYWPSTYWANNYWQQNYWLEYVVAPVTATASTRGRQKPILKPREELPLNAIAVWLIIHLRRKRVKNA